MVVIGFSGKAKDIQAFFGVISGWRGMESGIGPLYHWRRFGSRSKGVAVYWKARGANAS